MPLRIVHPRHVIESKAERGARAKLSYHGGPVLANAEVFLIFWGHAWTSDPLQEQIVHFFDFVLQSSLLDQLSEYSVPGISIGRGKFNGALIVDAKMPSSVDDSDIQNFLRSQINEGFVPGFGANSLYFVFTPSGVKVTLQGDASCQQFCGYHNVTNEGIVYAVDPYDDCAGCQFVPGDILGSTTVPASHELCEAITDPTFEGWFDDSTGQEIGDICAGQVKVINASGVASAGASPSFASSVDRKSTRLNSSHSQISYAVFCLKKKKKNNQNTHHNTTYENSQFIAHTHQLH